jgi:hypothetical protein
MTMIVLKYVLLIILERKCTEKDDGIALTAELVEMWLVSTRTLREELGLLPEGRGKCIYRNSTFP